MIKIDSIHIEEVRGIRKLKLEAKQKNLVVSGPNGSGKSGVIDAVEFGLTGSMKRLSGSGTKGISVAEHGPHVDKGKFPEASFVELTVYLTGINKSATIRRYIKKPKAPVITPDDADIKHVFEVIAAHPEITLSRRDIIRFILVSPTDRSQEIQSLLKLDGLGDNRKALNSACNALKRAHDQSMSSQSDAKNRLLLHLQIEALSKGQLLKVVNVNRTLLKLPPITNLDAQSKLDDGLTADENASRFNKTSAINTIKSTKSLIENLNEFGKDELMLIINAIEKLQQDTTLLTMIQQRELVEKGLELVSSPECPLCDYSWPDVDHLRSHLQSKIAKSKEAGELTESITNAASKLSAHTETFRTSLVDVYKVAKEIDAPEVLAEIEQWGREIANVKTSLEAIHTILPLKSSLENNWLKLPDDFQNNLDKLEKAVNKMPDQTAIIAAQTFLTTAQVRLADYRSSNNKSIKSEVSAKLSKIAYDTYCEVMELELNTLYDEVQKDFSDFYRKLNGDDEKSFSAKFTPTEGALALHVNFYDKGLFPPGAFHSEGHQDGMGVCLYLALMKRLFGDEFSFSLLDDVVMSVDVDHRRQFCLLLKDTFPNTQFILTTHDRLWAEQMKSAKLVTKSNSCVFHGWHVDTGPLVESSKEVWEEIDEYLDKGKVETAAGTLRRHLEYFASSQCDDLGASPQYKADGNYDLGGLLPAAVSRMLDLLKKATAAAHSWGEAQEQIHERAKTMRANLLEAHVDSGIEQWAVNKAVHYNRWANFGKNDFLPVVKSFKILVENFECKECHSHLHASPKHNTESLRCICGNINFNLNKKKKD